MKIRSGFVSNSSSSSFVVKRYEHLAEGSPKITTTTQDRLLKKNGFSLAAAYYPDQIVYPFPRITSSDRKYVNWCQEVVCNQYNVISFLIKNKISFSADIHYGHESMDYNAKTDVLIIAQNYGKQMQMRSSDKASFAIDRYNTDPIEKTTGKEYTKKYEN